MNSFENLDLRIINDNAEPKFSKKIEQIIPISISKNNGNKNKNSNSKLNKDMVNDAFKIFGIADNNSVYPKYLKKQIPGN